MAPVSCKLYFNYDSRPSDDWTINLEYDTSDPLAGGSIDAQTDALVGALAPMLLNNVIIDRAVWSTWQADSEPYNPDNVRTIPIGVPGQREFALTSPVDDDLALLIRKTVSSGKPGRIYLKGALLVSNITAEGGAWTLVDALVDDFNDYVDELDRVLSSAMQCQLIGAPLISTTYPATPAGVKQVPIKVYAAEPIARNVTELVLVGPTERQARQ